MMLWTKNEAKQYRNKVKGNEGLVSVGIEHDTAEVWWRKLGREGYGKVKSIRIMADGGGATGGGVVYGKRRSRVYMAGTRGLPFSTWDEQME
jgi:hypothetical protein